MVRDLSYFEFPDDGFDLESDANVQAWINSNLDAAMKKEADAWADSVLHGDNSGGELKGLFNGGRLDADQGSTELRDQ